MVTAVYRYVEEQYEQREIDQVEVGNRASLLQKARHEIKCSDALKFV